MKKHAKYMLIMIMVFTVVLAWCTSCGKNDSDANSSIAQDWMRKNHFDEEETTDQLYEKALTEENLVVYSVSTRVTKVKERFEKKYPGLCVEVRDLRSPDLIEAVKDEFESESFDCDVVICNDNSGAFFESLVKPNIVVPYIPKDIAEHMKEGYVGETVTFLDEAEMIFYNSGKYDECPISNIWELTDEKYRGHIYIPSPLRSFSTYAFCGSSLQYSEQLEKAYEQYYHETLDASDDSTAAMVFWRSLAANAIFTNSSDEVAEALGSKNSDADFGIMVSSKQRLSEVGYSLEPVYHLAPFCGCKTSFSVMIATGSKNVNSAKLFVRYMLGESTDIGEGTESFRTVGTWSARTDLEDGNPVPMEEIDLIVPNQEYLIDNRVQIETFWSAILKESNGENSEE